MSLIDKIIINKILITFEWNSSRNSMLSILLINIIQINNIYGYLNKNYLELKERK